MSVHIVLSFPLQSLIAIVCPEIATRFDIGLPVGLLAALLVVNRRLFKIASRTTTSSTRTEKRRALFIDLAIGLGIPLLQMALRGYHSSHL
jgi:pheromone a factor receptor